jgi:hypothetical protein
MYIKKKKKKKKKKPFTFFRGRDATRLFPGMLRNLPILSPRVTCSILGHGHLI